ncbi:MAG: hypothetical protein J5873_01525 [Bacteroidales bacterium]|nr:hypothetical protein [Bacteroidales bacterium]
MKRSLIIVLAAVSLICCTSCTGLRTAQTAKGFTTTPDFVRLDMNFDKMKPMGETTISIDTRTYFGVITILDKVNDVQYDRRNQSTVTLQGRGMTGLTPNMRKALSVVVDKYPNADYYVVASTKVETNQMFLGKHRHRTAVVKAYQYVH